MTRKANHRVVYAKLLRHVWTDVVLAALCFLGLFLQWAQGHDRVGAAQYTGVITAYIADLKASFPEHTMYSASTAITIDNFRAVLDGLKYNVGVNGVRLPIIPENAHASEVSSLIRQVHAYARHLNLIIYAGPMSVGFSKFRDWTDDRYATWLADYANAFQPDVLSPFNEAGIDDDRMARIVSALKLKLHAPVTLAGPDRQHVDGTIESLTRHDQTASLFDIIDSHNTNRDVSAYKINWTVLVRAARGKPVWSSENPASWSRGKREGLPGMEQAVLGGVSGIVVWLAKPTLVGDDGRATAKAHEIAANLVRHGPSR